MTLKGLETAVYFVDDLKAASQWYRKVLGVEPNYDSEYYVGFTVAGDEFGLHPADADKPSGGGGMEAYWSVDDIRAAIAHFVEHGAQALEVQDVGGGIQVGRIRDPFGNVLAMIQNPKSPNRT